MSKVKLMFRHICLVINVRGYTPFTEKVCAGFPLNVIFKLYIIMPSYRNTQQTHTVPVVLHGSVKYHIQIVLISRIGMLLLPSVCGAADINNRGNKQEN